MDGSSKAESLEQSSKPLPNFEIYRIADRYTSSPSNKCQKYDAFCIAQSPIEGQRDEDINAVCGSTLSFSQLC